MQPDRIIETCLAWGEHPTRVHGRPGIDDMSSQRVPRDGVCKQLRIEVSEQVDSAHVDGVDGLGVHQTVCGDWRIGQGLTDQTLKNIHAGWDNDMRGVIHQGGKGRLLNGS